MAKWSDGTDFLAAVDEGGGTVFIQFRSSIAGESLLPSVRATVLAARKLLLDTGALKFEVRLPADTPFGPIMRVAKCRKGTDIDTWVQALTEELERRRLPVELGVWRPIGQTIANGPFESIVGAVRLPLRREIMETDWGGTPPDRTWGLGEAVTQRLLAEADAFVSDAGGEATIRHLSVSFPVAGDDAMQFLRSAVRAQWPRVSIRRFKPDLLGRRVVFDRAGTVVFEIGDPAEGWIAAAARLSGVLLNLADVAAYGCVRKTQFGVPGYDAISWWPPRAPEQTPHQHMLWGRENFDLPPISDAHAIQLLSENHMPLLKDRSNWLIEQVAEGKYLVTARELEPWLDASEPDPAVLASAREDFSFPVPG